MDFVKSLVVAEDQDKLLNLFRDFYYNRIKETTSIINFYYDDTPSSTMMRNKHTLVKILTTLNDKNTIDELYQIYDNMNSLTDNFLRVMEKDIINYIGIFHLTRDIKNYLTEMKKCAGQISLGDKIIKPGVIIFDHYVHILNPIEEKIFDNREVVNIKLITISNNKKIFIIDPLVKKIIEYLREEERIRQKQKYDNFITLLLCIKKNNIYLCKDIKQLFYNKYL